jgi:ABC-type multidrug transport system permease subunit
MWVFDLLDLVPIFDLIRFWRFTVVLLIGCGLGALLFFSLGQTHVAFAAGVLNALVGGILGGVWQSSYRRSNR